MLSAESKIDVKMLSVESIFGRKLLSAESTKKDNKSRCGCWGCCIKPSYNVFTLSVGIRVGERAERAGLRRRGGYWTL